MYRRGPPPPPMSALRCRPPPRSAPRCRHGSRLVGRQQQAAARAGAALGGMRRTSALPRRRNVRRRTRPPLYSTCSRHMQGNALLTSAATPLAHALLERLPGEAEFVLIGEASHGTGERVGRRGATALGSHTTLPLPHALANVLPLLHTSRPTTEDFYKLRGELTKLLISERGFNAGWLRAWLPPPPGRAPLPPPLQLILSPPLPCCSQCAWRPTSRMPSEPTCTCVACRTTRLPTKRSLASLASPTGGLKMASVGQPCFSAARLRRFGSAHTCVHTSPRGWLPLGFLPAGCGAIR